MSELPLQQTEHEIHTSAAPDAVFAVLADARAWPAVFPPSVHVEQVEHTGSSERIRIWATANGSLRTWTSRRELDERARRIRFRQEVSAHPVAAMGGEWIVEEAGDGGTRVRLTHDFRAVDDDPETIGWIHRAVDRNSEAELASLRTALERPDGTAPTTFEDTVVVRGRAEDVYDFLHRSDLWKKRLSHVARIAVKEEEPGLQHMEMDTLTADGSVHTTASVRVCFPERRVIVYKQLRTPPLLALHLGRWSVRPADDGDGIAVTSAHTVSVARSAIPGVLGAGASETDAVDFVRRALGRNSLLTLEAARQYAESSA
ncbi:aromatase/cyclase [Streptomyces peucetius]|uniref:Daunorubicin-doxorubicin polyketide synthase n=1 Tax=Streptomyces peucetius TaxID=1950 RepID=Q54811_STRPE|nr:daunorubicin-doxorubicin polyketide synthase [Streptomyces peucetius]ATW50539.1 cyclase [Streptomyces peucetius subsp. caesius ATCC 27952]prf//2104259B doxorubicin polyketide synthase [Streptomyces peucetius]